MPIYHKLGQVAATRHTVFEKPGGGLYYEQLFGTIGFEGMSSLLYHLRPPTAVREVLGETDLTPKVAVAKNIKARLLKGFQVPPQDDYLAARTPVLVNGDVHISLAALRQSLTAYFYKNADADELLFIHRGTGRLRTQLGNIAFEPGDYLLVPRGIIYQIEFNSEDNRLLITESFHPVYTLKGYRNHFGQLLEHAPYSERDYKLPTDLESTTKSATSC